jgi:hypothetical protein
LDLQTIQQKTPPINGLSPRFLASCNNPLQTENAL